MSEAAVNVEIFDTTLRDGAQALPADHQFPEGSKPEIAEQIAEFGVSVIEAGFPATPGDAEAVAEVARIVGRRDYDTISWLDGQPRERRLTVPVIAGLSRTVTSDIEATWTAVQSAERPRIHTFISTDQEHMTAKFPGKSPQQVLEMGRAAVTYARNISAWHPGASVEFSAEAASTTDPAYLERVVKEAVLAGADVINMPDTVGQRDPFWMKDFYKRIITWTMQAGGATISAHNHNDLDNAVPNTWALVSAAAEYAHENNRSVEVQLESTVCGLGERAGNANVFPVVAGLFKFSPDVQVPIRWQINPDRAVTTADTVMDYAGLPVPPQSPIVGGDTFVHRSGIHSDGVIKGGHAIYTPHDPRFWGHSESARHEDGAYQGRAGKAAVSSTMVGA